MVFFENKTKIRRAPSFTTMPDQPIALKRRRKRRRIPRYFKIILGVLGGYLLFSFLFSGYQIRQIKQEIEQYHGQTAVLLQEQQELAQELATLQEPEMIETLARESLGLVKPGEILVVPAIPGENIPRP